MPNRFFLDLLTEREEQVLGQVANGLTDHEIARILCVSYRTVRTHLDHLFPKLSVINRVQAARMYWEREHHLTDVIKNNRPKPASSTCEQTAFKDHYALNSNQRPIPERAPSPQSNILPFWFEHQEQRARQHSFTLHILWSNGNYETLHTMPTRVVVRHPVEHSQGAQQTIRLQSRRRFSSIINSL